MSYLLQVVKPFTLTTVGQPVAGQITNFKVGDVIQVSNIHRTRGGFKTGIPIKTANGWEYSWTTSSNLAITTVCGIVNDDEPMDYGSCVSPSTIAIDNEVEAGEDAPPPTEEESSSGSPLLKATAWGVGLYIWSKLKF